MEYKMALVASFPGLLHLQLLIVFAYCKRSTTGSVEGEAMALTLYSDVELGSVYACTKMYIRVP